MFYSETGNVPKFWSCSRRVISCAILLLSITLSPNSFSLSWLPWHILFAPRSFRPRRLWFPQLSYSMPLSAPCCLWYSQPLDGTNAIALNLPHIEAIPVQSQNNNEIPHRGKFQSYGWSKSILAFCEARDLSISEPIWCRIRHTTFN